MSLDPDYFQAEAAAFRDQMSAAILLERGVCYDGRIAGQDCIVVGIIKDPHDPMKEIVPLAIVITSEIFDLLEVPGKKVKGE